MVDDDANDDDGGDVDVDVTIADLVDQRDDTGDGVGEVPCPRPSMVMVVPPSTGPLRGLTRSILG